jgi:DNA-binding NtrC family response regulator
MPSSNPSVPPASTFRAAAGPFRFGAMVSSSSHMKEVFDLAAELAVSRIDLVIEGERGTGKQLLAREIHRRSPFAAGPFVVARVEGSGERGWTEAIERRYVEAAEGGTLYVEELARIPPRRLVELLRVLDRTSAGVCAPGARSVAARRPAVRIMAATRVDLAGLRGEGRFREELNRRFAWFPLRIPSLAARPEDIGLLADYYLARLAWRARSEPLRLGEGARAALRARAFQGNVRELELALSRAARVARDGEIAVEDLPAELIARPTPRGGSRARRPVPPIGADAPRAANDVDGPAPFVFEAIDGD